jgi:hypothetical protein
LHELAYGAAVQDAIGAVLAEFEDAIGRPPTIFELTEILSRSIPRGQAGVVGAGLVVRGGTRRRVGDVSAVDHLNDAAFVLAAPVFDLLEDRPGGLTDLAVTLTEVIAAARLTGFEPGMRLGAIGKPVRQRPKIGDVVAIPASLSGHFHASIVARNGFGTAFGLVHGRRAEATLPGPDDVVDPYPVYSDEKLIREGTWRVVGRSTELLGRFPAEPEIFHLNGIAESPQGTVRALSDQEEAELGVPYDHFYLSDFLQSQLTAGILPLHRPAAGGSDFR